MPRLQLTLGFVIACAVLPTAARGETKVGAWSAETNAAWWQANGEADSWAAERGSIHNQLLLIQERIGITKALGNSNFTGWVNHLKWLSLFPETRSEHDFFNDMRARRTFIAIALKRPDVRDAFLNALSPYDDQEKAVEILCQIFMEQTTDAFQYPSLAIALSLVFDQPFPDGWPHHFVDAASVPRGTENPARRFAYLVESQEKGALFYDLKRLAISDLKFIVDTPVPLKELAYVQQVKTRGVKRLHDLFTTIKYDMPRLQRREYIWPHGGYDLFTIGKKGGLCVDQAYFTAHTAKAKGVPCIVFLGQGNSGEHAWLGYLEKYGRWQFDLAVHVQNKRWEQADETFRGAMQKLASKEGGHLFYQLVQPYVQACLEEGKGRYAREAMERARRSFREAKLGSILDKDLKELADLVKAKTG